MKANEILTQMKDETVLGMFQFMRENHRDIYSASVLGLTKARRLRPVFVQRKPVPEQIEWMAKSVRMKASAEVADTFLQFWLLKAHSPMLVAFLDALGVSHDGAGATKLIPDHLDRAKVKEAVAKLLAEFDHEAVRAYLHTFQLQKPGGWDEISELIAVTPELQFRNAAEQSPDKSQA